MVDEEKIIFLTLTGVAVYFKMEVVVSDNELKILAFQTFFTSMHVYLMIGF